MTLTIISNDRTTSRAWGDLEEAVLSTSGADEALAGIREWSGYKPTLLRFLPGLAGENTVASIAIKDEAGRFGLGSFKALGGAWAVEKLVRQHSNEITVCCATDGNHGRSVAWGAARFGCRCVIYLHAHVSEGREQAIAKYGAEIRRVDGGYDDSVRQAEADAKANGWTVVSDTSYPGYMEIPRDVMQGYTVMVREAVEQWHDAQTDAPTHVFLQTGVGGFAAAAVSVIWRRYGANRPKIVLVDPSLAACWVESIRNGKPTAVEVEEETVMAGLSCGEISALTWAVLEPSTDFVVSLGDEHALATMKLLAAGVGGDAPMVAGESGVAGLAGFLAAAGNDADRQKLGIDESSRILTISTEGATDPEVYRQIVGKPADEVGNA